MTSELHEETDIEKGILKKIRGYDMTSELHGETDIEKEILKEMQPKSQKYYLLGQTAVAGLNGFWAGAFGESWTYLFAGMTAISIALIASSIADIRSASRDTKRIVSALNNEERGTLDMLLKEEKAKEALLQYDSASGRWHEMPLEEQLKDIAEQANSLFGYNGIRLPKIKRSMKTGTAVADYSPLMKLIRVSESEKVTPCILAHEYVHHLEKIKKNSCQWKWNPFWGEGIAVAGGTSIAENYAMKTGDKEMEKDALSQRINCLYKFRFMFQSGFLLHLEGSRMLINYVVAPTAFFVAERKHGNGIYRDILDSKKPLNLLTDMVCGRKA